MELFKSFKGNKKGFSKLNSDKRCKVQPIDIFINGIEKDWIIDKLWNEKEKMELRIVDTNNTLTIHEFSELLSEFSCLTKEYSNILSKVVIDSEDSVCFTTVKIGEIFDVVKGKSKYTKSYMNKHKGKYPVYSSKTSEEGIIANIDTYDHDCKCLTWTTDGTYVGTVFLRDGKFSMTTHCGALFLREEFRDKVSLEYMEANLNNILPLHKEGEGSNRRLGVTRIEKIQINIPIDTKKDYDIEAQRKIAKRYSRIKEIKKNVKIELAQIENIKVDTGL